MQPIILSSAIACVGIFVFAVEQVPHTSPIASTVIKALIIALGAAFMAHQVGLL